MIRHGEKPADGNNLTCQGLNRSLQLPAIIKNKFGVPNYVYVPAPGSGESTKRARMFQTATPLAVKFDLDINTSYGQKNPEKLADDIKNKKGTVLLIWEHNAIIDIAEALGVKQTGLNWPNDDYDSIWIVTFPKGVATLTKDKEGIKPSANCNF